MVSIARGKRFETVALRLAVGLTLVFSRATLNDGRRMMHDESTPQPSAVSRQPSAFERLPLSFEANQGQADDPVKFLSRGQGYRLLLSPTEAALTLRNDERRMMNDELKNPNSSFSIHHSSFPTVRMRLVGGNPAPRLVGLEGLPGKVNAFVGNDPTKWRTNIPTYAKVKYEGVYPGVDLVYYGNQRQLEYDFIVAPGADPRVIRMELEGADTLAVDAQGDLVLSVGVASVRFRKPFVYQEVHGRRVEIEGAFNLFNPPSAIRHPPSLVAFEIDDYDPTRPLVIDPAVVYSTYLGGNDIEGGLTIESTYQAIAVDADGNVYVTGRTESNDFQTANALQPANRGGFFGADAFVLKLNPQGTALLYSTYLGGSMDDEARDIAVDAAGNAYITGVSDAADFPTTAGAFRTTDRGVFVTKLDPSGGLVYSSQFGGFFRDEGNSIAVDGAGNAYVTGETSSNDFPATVGAFQTRVQFIDAFVTKLNAGGSGLVYSTYLGGSGTDRAGAIAVDADGHAYVTGQTGSTNFPRERPYQATFGGGFPGDVFVTKLNPSGTALVYSTYLGGSGDDRGSGIAVDANGNAYLTGQTSSANFPVTPSFQMTFGGTFPQSDAFITKFSIDGSMLAYSTYLGGMSNDVARDIAVDAAGNAYIIGTTFSSDFPTRRALRPGGTSNDPFVAVLNPAGSRLVYSTYFGGDGHVHEAGIGIAVDTAGNAYITGQTDSTDFPRAGALQSMFGGGTSDAFIAKIAP